MSPLLAYKVSIEHKDKYVCVVCARKDTSFLHIVKEPIFSSEINETNSPKCHICNQKLNTIDSKVYSAKEDETSPSVPQVKKRGKKPKKTDE